MLVGYQVSFLHRVVSVVDEVNVVAGYVLTKECCAAEWFFLIHSGEAEVVRRGTRLGVLGAGDYFGEVALLGRGAQPATVRALTAMTLFVIAAQRFVPLVDDIPRLRRDMDAALIRQAELVRLAREERELRLRPPAPISAKAPISPRSSRFPTLERVAIPRRTDDRPRLPARWRLGLASTFLAVVVPVAAVALLYHPPYVVVAPGPAIDLSGDVVISGVPAHAPRGRYLMITARMSRPNLLGLCVAWLRVDRQVVRVDRVAKSGSGGANQRGMLPAQFAASQTEAAAAAARVAGLPVSVTGGLPFAVHFRSRDVVGPSAGLIYALQIEDMLTATDRARGRTIAATGQIDPTGAVSSVGFVTEKAETARRAGAQLLIVPQDEAGSASGSGVPVDGVDSLHEALSDLSAG